jgi:hypothetical protein
MIADWLLQLWALSHRFRFQLHGTDGKCHDRHGISQAQMCSLHVYAVVCLSAANEEETR